MIDDTSSEQPSLHSKDNNYYQQEALPSVQSIEAVNGNNDVNLDIMVTTSKAEQKKKQLEMLKAKFLNQRNKADEIVYKDSLKMIGVS